MSEIINIDKSEEAARKNPVCLGCFANKGIGLVVCWTCFKVDGERPAYKYFSGTFNQWLLLKRKY